MSDRSVLFLAIAEWLSPTGQKLWHQGVAPTIQVQLPEDVDALLPGAERYLRPETFIKLEDRQLRKALGVLGARPELVAQAAMASGISE